MQIANTLFAAAILDTERVDAMLMPSTERVAQMTCHRSMPRLVCLEFILTEGCNLQCSYCFEADKNSHHRMTHGTAVSAVDLLLGASRDAQDVQIQFLGGEPMLCYPLIRKVVEYGNEQAEQQGKRIHFGMTTNGTLLEEEHARWFRDVGLRYILSLDGGEEDHDRHRKTAGGRGSFRPIAAKLRMLKSYQPWQGAQMVVTPEATLRIRKNVEELHDLGINQFQVTFATGIDWDDGAIANYSLGLKDLFEFYIREITVRHSTRMRVKLFELDDPQLAYVKGRRVQMGCGAGSGSMAVSPRGVLYGCAKLASINGFGNPLLPLGRIPSGIENPANRSLLLDRSSRVRTKCRWCELFDICSGGCYAENHRATGNIYVPEDSYCKLIFAQKAACDYARTRMAELTAMGLKA